MECIFKKEDILLVSSGNYFYILCEKNDTFECRSVTLSSIKGAFSHSCFTKKSVKRDFQKKNPLYQDRVHGIDLQQKEDQDLFELTVEYTDNLIVLIQFE